MLRQSRLNNAQCQRLHVAPSSEDYLELMLSFEWVHVAISDTVDAKQPSTQQPYVLSTVHEFECAGLCVQMNGRQLRCVCYAMRYSILGMMQSDISELCFSTQLKCVQLEREPASKL